MRWSVCATVAEPAPLLVAFAAHHLDLGAAQVHLFLDRPNPQLHALIGADPRVSLIDSDADFYAALGRRYPVHINRRQIINAAIAEAHSDADWLFHLDADEFLSADPSAELAAVPDTALGVQVENGERVFLASEPPRTIFDGALALQVWDPAQLERLRGPGLTEITRAGFLAHVLGKGACRVGRGVRAGIHSPRVKRGEAVTLRSTLVSHFDGLTRLHWALKLQRHEANQVRSHKAHANARYRDNQIALAAECAGELSGILALHDHVRVLSNRRARRMRRAGRLLSTGVDAEIAIARQFPGLVTDLSIAGFDAGLAAAFPGHRSSKAA